MSVSPNPTFPHSPYVPFDPDVALYDGILRPFLIPWEYSGWRNEQLSWKETCYLHGNLNPTPTIRLHGPGARDFLASTIVNNVERFPIGTGKHAILCNDEGSIMAHGVLLRTAEDDYEGQWLSPYIDFAVSKDTGDFEAENVTGRTFLFQMAGPTSFAVLTDATGDDLSDIQFMQFRSSSIAGRTVRILRMGMGGALAYEVHGEIEDALEIYQAILDAGQRHGIRRLGTFAYLMNHTENGFPQSFYHFTLAWSQDPEFVAWVSSLTHGKAETQKHFEGRMRGSAGQVPDRRFRTPYDLGWDKMVRFNHDFRGRAALERIAAAPPRTMVTLRWSVDDVVDIYRSQFEPGEHFAPIDAPISFNRSYGGSVTYMDIVQKDGESVGLSSGRAYSYYSREMISLCSIDRELARIGTEVEVVWGEPGDRQKLVRATVERFPYLDLPRNRDVDVAQLAAAAGAAR